MPKSEFSDKPIIVPKKREDVFGNLFENIFSAFILNQKIPTSNFFQYMRIYVDKTKGEVFVLIFFVKKDYEKVVSLARTLKEKVKSTFIPTNNHQQAG